MVDHSCCCPNNVAVCPEYSKKKKTSTDMITFYWTDCLHRWREWIQDQLRSECAGRRTWQPEDKKRKRSDAASCRTSIVPLKNYADLYQEMTVTFLFWFHFWMELLTCWGANEDGDWPRISPGSGEPLQYNWFWQEGCRQQSGSIQSTKPSETQTQSYNIQGFEPEMDGRSTERRQVDEGWMEGWSRIKMGGQMRDWESIRDDDRIKNNRQCRHTLEKRYR